MIAHRRPGLVLMRLEGLYLHRAPLDFNAPFLLVWIALLEYVVEALIDFLLVLWPLIHFATSVEVEEGLAMLVEVFKGLVYNGARVSSFQDLNHLIVLLSSQIQIFLVLRISFEDHLLEVLTFWKNIDVEVSTDQGKMVSSVDSRNFALNEF